MEKKTGWIITGVTAALCGCPGACLLLFGAMMALGGSAADLGIEGIDTTGDPLLVGVVMLVLGLFMFVIPVIMALYTQFRGKEPQAVTAAKEDEIPPSV
jgi:hypothetical protein